MKIGLIALSGIRVQDAELMNLGLTLPGFVERAKTIASLPSLGLLTLAGLTPARHEVRYLEVVELSDLPDPPRDFDLVAISCLSAQVKEAFALADRYRDLGIPVVMGSLHVTSNPGEPRAHGVIAAVGEGEVLWPEILADAETGTLRPLYDARGREFDLADAPMPAYELLDLDRYNRVTVQTSRGCPWKCSFCASSILLTGRYKQKPLAKVLAEVDRIRELWPRPFIEFADDNSFVNRRYWKELLPELKKRRIRWFTETDLSVHEDEELLRLMREAGCVEVLIGFESPVPEALEGLELRGNFKRRRFEDSKVAIRRIQSAGIRVNACFVLGLDGHGPEVFEALLAFVEEALPFDVQVTVPTPFPGTPFHARLEREGRLLAPGAWERCTLFDVNFRPLGMSPEALRDGLRRVVVALYSEEATARRHLHFAREDRRRARRACA